jgi:hypothetical protein
MPFPELWAQDQGPQQRYALHVLLCPVFQDMHEGPSGFAADLLAPDAQGVSLYVAVQPYFVRAGPRGMTK